MLTQRIPLPYLSPPPDGDQHIGVRLIAMGSVLIVLGTILVALRLYVRTRITRTLGLDDLFVVMSLLLSWVVFILDIVAVDAGEGRHLYYLSLDQAQKVSKHLHIAIPFFNLATGCSRLSISLALLRIASPGRRWKYVLYGLITFAAMNWVAMFFTDWLVCVPARKMWNPLVPGKCWSNAAQSHASLWVGTFSVVYDFVLATLPGILIRNVKISLRRKLGICMLMGLGFMAGACAIARTVLSVHPLSERSDLTWDTVNEVMWAGLELGFLLITTSIPAIQPLFKRSQYRRGYVPDDGRSDRGLRPNPSKAISKDPYPIDDDDERYPSPPPKTSTSTSGSSEVFDREIQMSVQDSAR